MQFIKDLKFKAWAALLVIPIQLLWNIMAGSANAQPIETIWFGPTNFVSGDPTLDISYPSTQHPAVEIRATHPGGLKWVYLGLDLPAGTEIRAVRVCYQLTNSMNFISQIRLLEMQRPAPALVRHDDATHLTSITPSCHVSQVAGYRPDGGVILALRLNFGSSGDKIILGAVGVDVAVPDQLLASYIIFTDGTNIYARNGVTGRIDYQGTDASTVIRQTLVQNRKVYIRSGTYHLAGSLDLPSNFTLEMESGAVLEVPPGYSSYVFGLGDQVHNTNIIGGMVLEPRGPNPPQRRWEAIRLHPSTHGVYFNSIRDTWIENSGIGIKLMLDGPHSWINGNEFKSLRIWRSNIFIDFDVRHPVVDCDGSATSTPGPCASNSDAARDTVKIDNLDFDNNGVPDRCGDGRPQPLCTDDLFFPTVVAQDDNCDCSDGPGGTVILGTNGSLATREVRPPVAGEPPRDRPTWAFNDEDGDSLFDNGEDLYVLTRGINHNHFEGIVAQAVNSTTFGARNIRRNANTFVNVRFFDMHLDSTAVTASIHEDARETIILGGSMTYQNFEDHGKGTQVIDRSRTLLQNKIAQAGLGLTIPPTANVDLNSSVGYDQLRLRRRYTPTGPNDPNGEVGSICWDNRYVYIKTTSGWRRAALDTW